MINKIIIILLLVLVNCEHKHSVRGYVSQQRVCKSDSSTNIRATWINQCILNANPKSDEEPEDWLHKCINEGWKLYPATDCKTAFMWRSHRRQPWLLCSETIENSTGRLDCLASGWISKTH